jgi:outer membrane biosynthesis protein TonB
VQEKRGIEMRTLVIASVASAAAAVITSQFWIRGTPIAAALTPVIVALVSELLHRPTEKIAQRMTTETDALPEAAGAIPPPPAEEVVPRPARDPEINVYRSGGSARKRTIAWTAVLTTGLLAFAIAALVLTVPELIAGGSIGGRDRATTLVPSKKQDRDGGQDQTVTEQQTVTETVPAEPEPTTETAPEPPPAQRTTPTTPSEQQRQAPPTTTTTPPGATSP